MRANINRGRWIEEAIIDEDIANDFESKLNTFWTNNIRRIKIVHSDLSDQNQGKLLYSECMVKNELIRDMAPPDSTVSGTYHELADSPVLGWHPDWETNIKK
jgi:hypothetical protein